MSPAVEVDFDRRLIRGQVLPYRVVGVTSRRRTRYHPGTLTWPALDLVPVLAEHGNAHRLGCVAELQEDDDELQAVLRIRPGRRGDRALQRVKDGTWRGLSPGLEQVRHNNHRGVLDCVAAVLVEITLTPAPVFMEVTQWQSSP